MLLIVSNSTDATVEFAEQSFAARKLRYWRLDTDRYPQATRLTLRPGAALLTSKDFNIDLTGVRAVWWRRPIPPRIVAGDQAVDRWASEEARLALDGALRSMDAHWVNHPDNNRVAQDKIGQLQRAADIGFAVPDWIVTNDAANARAFTELHPGGMVAKPLGAGQLGDGRTLWTSRVEPSAIADLGPEPYLFQRFVRRRADLRVTVVGDDLFAVAIDSSEHPEARDDWRRAGRDAHHKIVALDATTATRCLALTRSFGLSFAAIDLALDEEGRTWFFEVNPNGQWAWLEEATGVPITASLIDHFQRYG